MRTKYPFIVKVHYLTAAGKYLTPNATQGRSSLAITGPLSGSTTSDPIMTPNQRELALNFTVQSSGGSNPTADIYLDVLDPIEPQNKNTISTDNVPVTSIKLNPAQITSPGLGLRVVIANGIATAWQNNEASNLGSFNVPMRWQVRFVLGASATFGIIATFEGRE